MKFFSLIAIFSVSFFFAESSHAALSVICRNLTGQIRVNISTEGEYITAEVDSQGSLGGRTETPNIKIVVDNDTTKTYRETRVGTFNLELRKKVPAGQLVYKGRHVNAIQGILNSPMLMIQNQEMGCYEIHQAYHDGRRR